MSLSLPMLAECASFASLKCGQRTGNTLFRAFILFTDNGLHGFDNEFGFHVQALRVFNLK